MKKLVITLILNILVSSMYCQTNDSILRKLTEELENICSREYINGFSVAIVNQDGTLYEGYFHIHLDHKAAMTGNEHTEDSQDLYYANGKPTRNTGLPYGVVEQNKQRKIQARKNLRKNRRR